MINERHKVMHHRPIQFVRIEALQKKNNELFALLDLAKPELSEIECKEVQREITYLRDKLTSLGAFGDQQLAQLAAKIKETIEPFGDQQLAQLAAKIKETIEPFGDQQLAQLAAKIKETIESFGE